MDSILDALGYVGDVLAKPGRAVRGLLTGNARESLAALPFSDSLGLTDQSQAVDGRGLLRAMGIDAGDGTAGDVASFATDVLTDPLSYLGGAGLARGGKLLAGAGLGRGVGATTRAVEHGGGIFDLVSPADRELAKLAPGSLGEATSVAAREVAPQAATSPLAEALGHAAPIAEPAAPVRQAITELQPVDTYAHLIGYGPSARGHSIANDILADGGSRREALLASLQGWDETLRDIEGMGAEGRRAVGVHPLGGATLTNNTPEAARQWLHEISTRQTDLRGIQQLAPAIPGYEELRPAIDDQLSRLKAIYHGSWNKSELGYTASDLRSGHVKPSDIPGNPVLSHLPVDERLLRKLAAEAQAQSIPRQVSSDLSNILQPGLTADDVLLDHEPAQLLQYLREALDPKSFSNHEPGIVKQVFSNPSPVDDWGVMQLAQDLLEHLTGSRHVTMPRRM